MQFTAKNDGRIKDPIWLELDPLILDSSEVRFSADVSNKADVDILTPKQAIEIIDFEVLFTFMDWNVPEIKQRHQAAKKAEILVPKMINADKILGIKNG